MSKKEKKAKFVAAAKKEVVKEKAKAKLKILRK